ncbi:glycoside hydrolase family 95-like protein [Cohnella rhizosphaerae]|uniref:glycoside hydrolase family 95-like protein n=1 Tax=Cohnella rhizosphaerae TaxID=1457232 RepID=UPI0030B8DB34
MPAASGGLKARGNAEVDLAWSDGALTKATIRAGSPLRAALRYGNREKRLNLRAGETADLNAELIASSANRT